MKITGYQPTVQLNAGNAPKVQAAGDINAFGGTGKALGEIGQGLEQMAVVQQKKIEQDMVTSVTQANTEYNKRIDDLMYGDDGLLKKQLGAAKTIDVDFVAKEKQIRADVSNMIPKYKKAELAFNTMTDKDAEQRFNIIRKYSSEQADKERDFNFSNAMDLTSSTAQNNYAIPSVISTQLDKAKKLTWATYGSTRGDAYCNAIYKKTEADMIVKSVQTAIANGDTASANNLIATFGTKISPENLNPLRANLTKINETNTVLTKAKEIAQQAGFDPNKANEIVEGLSSVSNKVDYQTFKTKLFGNESGGNYDAVNKKSGAIGKYQIMPDNWPSWAEDAGLSSDAKPTPENQEIVADAKLRPLYDKYGVEGAFVAWYAGEGNAQRWVDGAPDAIGDDGNHYSWDAPQGDNGSDPSVRQYVKNGTEGLQPKQMSAIEKEQLRNAVLNEISLNKTLKKARISQVADSASSEMFEQYKSGIRDPQVFADIANKYGTDSDSFEMANKEAAYYIALSNGKGQGLTNAEESKLIDIIDLGQVDDKEVLRAKLNEAGATPEQKTKFLNMFDASKKKEGKYQYDYPSLKDGFFKFIGVKDDDLWNGAKGAADEFIANYKETHNGNMPTFQDVQDVVNKAGLKPRTSTWFGNKSSDAAGYEKLGIRQATMINMGLADAEDMGNGKITITYNNGQTDDVDAASFKAKVDEIEKGYLKKK